MIFRLFSAIGIRSCKITIAAVTGSFTSTAYKMRQLVFFTLVEDMFTITDSQCSTVQFKVHGTVVRVRIKVNENSKTLQPRNSLRFDLKFDTGDHGSGIK